MNAREYDCAHLLQLRLQHCHYICRYLCMYVYMYVCTYVRMNVRICEFAPKTPWNYHCVIVTAQANKIAISIVHILINRNDSSQKMSYIFM